jgi:membrane protein
MQGDIKRSHDWMQTFRQLSRSSVASILKTAAIGWWEDRALSMGAAIAFYAIFSLAPVLLIVIAIGGLVFGGEAAQGAVLAQFSGLIGQDGANAVARILESASNFGSGLLGTAIGVGTFIVTASGAFGELQNDLNAIWRAPPPKYSGVVAFLVARLLSLTMVAVIAFLLMTSLTFDALASAASQYFRWQQEALLVQLANLAISVVMSGLLFGFIFKVLPSVHIAWRTVVPGAVLTAVLFVLGKFVIGLYLGRSNLASTYGAAASVISLMLWVYYSSQILLFGAEFTKAYAQRKEKPVRRTKPHGLR